jgi:hypothetical protein
MTVLSALDALTSPDFIAQSSVVEEIACEGAIATLIETCERSDDEAVVAAALKAISALANPQTTPQILDEAPRILRVCASPAGESALQHIGTMICNISRTSAASPEHLIEAGMVDALVKICRNSSSEPEVLANATHALALLCATSGTKVGGAVSASVLLPVLVDMLYMHNLPSVVLHACTCLRHLAHVEDFSILMLNQGAVEQFRALLGNVDEDGSVIVAAAAAALGAVGRACISDGDAKFDELWLQVINELGALCGSTQPPLVQANIAFAIGAFAIGAFAIGAAGSSSMQFAETICSLIPVLQDMRTAESEEQNLRSSNAVMALGNISLLPTACEHLPSIAGLLMPLMTAPVAAAERLQSEDPTSASCNDVAASLSVSLANCSQQKQVRAMLAQDEQFLPILLQCCFCVTNHSTSPARDLVRLQACALHLLSVLAFEEEHGVLILTQSAAPMLLAICSTLCEQCTNSGVGCADDTRSLQDQHLMWWALRAGTRCLAGLAATRDGAALLLKQESTVNGQLIIEVSASIDSATCISERL